MHCGLWVFIVGIQVTLPVIGNHNTGQPAVHPEVWVAIADKHQQTHGVVPPADLVLAGDTQLLWKKQLARWRHKRTAGIFGTLKWEMLPHKRLLAWWRRNHTPCRQCLQIYAARRLSRWTCWCCSSETRRACSQTSASRCRLHGCNVTRH